MGLNVLDLPGDVVLLIAELLPYEDLMSFLSIAQIFYILQDDIKLVASDPQNPQFFKFRWCKHQLIKLEPPVRAEGNEDVDERPQKIQKLSHGGKIHLIELPNIENSKSLYDLESDLLTNTHKSRFIAVSSSVLNEESRVSYNGISSLRTVSDSLRVILPLSFVLQSQIPTFFRRFTDSSIILKGLKHFTSFDSPIDPSKLHFTDLETLCLIDTILPKNIRYKLQLPNLKILRVEEKAQGTSESHATSILDILDLTKYPSSEFRYFYSGFVRAGTDISLFVENISFDTLKDIALLESVTSWKNIKFPILEHLLISTINKNDHTKYSYITNFEAPNLKRLTIEYDCQHFPRITNVQIPKSAVISIKAVCNIYWVHHHDTTLISQVNKFLEDYEHLEIINALDLLGCTPTDALKTLKVFADGMYWHVAIMTVPKINTSLERLLIKLTHETLEHTILIPAPNLKELKVSNWEGCSYDLFGINKQYPKLQKLQAMIRQIETEVINLDCISHEFKDLRSLILISYKEFPVSKLLDYLEKFSFPKLKELTVVGYSSSDPHVKFQLSTAPNIRILNLHNLLIDSESIPEDSFLDISGFSRLRILSFPHQISYLKIDKISTLKKIILPENDSTFIINDFTIDDELVIPEHPKIEIETTLDNIDFQAFPSDDELVWPSYA